MGYNEEKKKKGTKSERETRYLFEGGVTLLLCAPTAPREAETNRSQARRGI